MHAIGEYWHALGKRLEADVAAQPGWRERFDVIASRALTELPAPRMTAADIGQWMTETKTLPEQVNVLSGFGEPPLVVYQTPEFYAEVLFWFPSPTTIHGHGFTGAFVVLDGFSIEVRYDFRPEREPGEAVLLGRLEPREVEFIGPGKVCAILGASDYVHSVTHLGNPSLTLVVRTYGRSNNRQYRFHRSGFAACSNFRQTELKRRAAVLAAIWRADPARFVTQFVDFLTGADEHAFYWVTEALITKLPLPFVQNEVLPLLTQHFADRVAVLAALREVFRTRSLWTTMRTLPNVRAQVQVALADSFPDAAEREAILRKSYGAGAQHLPEQWRDLVAATTPA